jgi:lambda family phage minor tail protein L
MRIVSSAFIAEKNKVATASATIVLLEIQLDALTIRLAANNEDILWNSQTWQAFPFEIDTLDEAGQGEIPSIVVKVSNETTEIQQYLEAEDGAQGAAVIIRVINTEASSSTEAELELNLVLETVDWDEHFISFRLTGPNCLSRRVPDRRYLKDFCPFTYGGIRCGVTAATMVTYPTCNGTRANCIERGNSTRFGGFPWMPE